MKIQMEMDVDVDVDVKLEQQLQLELEVEWSWSWSWSWSYSLGVKNILHALYLILQFHNQVFWRSYVINETLDDIIKVISQSPQIPFEHNHFIHQIIPQNIWGCWI